MNYKIRFSIHYKVIRSAYHNKQDWAVNRGDFLYSGNCVMKHFECEELNELAKPRAGNARLLGGIYAVVVSSNKAVRFRIEKSNGGSTLINSKYFITKKVEEVFEEIVTFRPLFKLVPKLK